MQNNKMTTVAQEWINNSSVANNRKFIYPKSNIKVSIKALRAEFIEGIVDDSSSPFKEDLNDFEALDYHFADWLENKKYYHEIEETY